MAACSVSVLLQLSWRNKQSGRSVAEQIVSLNPDVLLIMMSSSAGHWALGQLWRGMQALKWTPKAISFGGTIAGLETFLPNGAADMHYVLTTMPWDRRLKGPKYKSRTTQSNFELLPGVALMDAPMVRLRSNVLTCSPIRDCPQHFALLLFCLRVNVLLAGVRP
jgi:hypothetical protein